MSWSGGQLVVSSRESPALPFTAEDPAILGLLQAFATPADPEEVVGRFDQSLGGRARAVVRELASVGVLQPAATTTVSALPPPSPQAEAELRARIASLPFLQHEDLGLTVTNCGKDELSRGCRACKEGTWVCVFVGLRCNATCTFCPQPAVARGKDEAGMGTAWVDRLLRGLADNRAKVKGVSLSGGEPLMHETEVSRIVRFARAELPGVYLWLYTNGILATTERLQRLRDDGLDEIRFNLAASEFSDKTMGHARKAAAGIFPWVSVEVPVYELTVHHLVKLDKLSVLSDMGVKQLNLGQLFSGSPSSLVMQNFGAIFPAPSARTAAAVQLRHWTFDIFEHAEKKRLPIRINDCSDDAKKVQQLARQHLGGDAMLALMDLAHPYPDYPRDAAAPPAGAARDGDVSFATLAPGFGARRPEDTDCVVLRYVGWSSTGDIVDSSYRSGLDGVPVKVSQIAAPLASGIKAMSVGEKRRFWLPDGTAAPGESAPRWVVYDLELVGLRPTERPC